MDSDILSPQRLVVSYVKRALIIKKKESRIAAREDIYNHGAVTTLERYRALRGTIIHVIPRLEQLKPIHCGRRAAPHLSQGVMGICTWCNEPCYWPNRWHYYCRLWYWMLGDGPEWNWRPPKLKKVLNWANLVPKTSCNACGANKTKLTLDHIIPITYAARLTKRDYIRSFMPHNLQWLCVTCHGYKTNQDNIKLKQLKKDLGVPVMPPRWGVNAPIQFPGESESRKKKFPGKITMP